MSAFTHVRIQQPGGAALRASESLALYLANRPALPAFKFGHWLASASDATLAQLMNAALAFEKNAVDPSTMDLVSVGMIAMAAEAGKGTQTVSSEDLTGFCARSGYYVELERMRRRGWVSLLGDISVLTPDSAQVELTDKGLREMGDYMEVLG